MAPLQFKTPNVFSSPSQLRGTDAERVSLVIRPRNKLFFNQALLIAAGVEHLIRVPESKLRVDIADLDMDMQRGLRFLPYAFDPASQETLRKLFLLFEKLSNSYPQLKGRITINIFSEWLVQPGPSSVFSSVISDRSSMKHVKRLICGGSGHPYSVPFWPVCKECNHVSSAFSLLLWNHIELSGVCKNPSCKNFNRHFTRNILEPKSYCVFYFFDNSADIFDVPGFGYTDIHFTGLDPSRNFGPRHIPTARVCGALLDLLSDRGQSPAFYKSPRLVDYLGFRASKVTLDHFADFLGLGSAEAIGILVRVLSTVEKSDLSFSDIYPGWVPNLR